MISELLKGRFNRGLRENLYFWRDNTGNEVDCIVEHGDRLLALEMKSGQTVTSDSLKGLRYWLKISGEKAEDACLVYGGDRSHTRKEGAVRGWKSFAKEIPSEI